jgi:hypothetical protein
LRFLRRPGFFCFGFGVTISLDGGLEEVSWSSEFVYPIWAGRLAAPTTRLGCKESLDQDNQW